MLIHDLRIIGNNLLRFRKQMGLTQAELAEKAGLADRTYADIERGTVNMRVITLIKICEALHVQPNDILTMDDEGTIQDSTEIIKIVEEMSTADTKTALQLLQMLLGLITKGKR